MKEARHIFTPQKVIQHIQYVQFSLTLYSLDANTLLLEWDNVEAHYKIGVREIESVLEAIEQFTNEKKVCLIIKTYAGISLHQKAIKFLQSNAQLPYLQAVAFILMNSTHRITINIYAKMHRSSIVFRGFMSEELAYNWLRKQQTQALKKK